MARKTASRMDMRREAEAAEAQGTKKKATKKTTRKKATRKKASSVVRRKLVWGIFSGSYKEEARFPYDQRKEAEEKLEALRARSSKKLFFIQPIKENLGETTETPAVEDEPKPVAETANVEEVETTNDEAADLDDVELDDDVLDDMEIEDDEEEEQELPAEE